MQKSKIKSVTNENKSSPKKNITHVIPQAIVGEIASFTDRKGFCNLAQVNHFFKKSLNHRIYAKLPAPAIDIGAFAVMSADKNTITLDDSEGCAVSTYIQLKNGKLLSGSYANHDNNSKICLWELENGALLSQLSTLNGEITNFFEIEKNIVAVSYRLNGVDVYDFNGLEPVKLISINLPLTHENIVEAALLSPGQLAFISGDYLDTCHLRILHYAKRLDSESISLEHIATAQHGEAYRHVFSLKHNKLLLATTHHLFVYDLNIKEKSAPIKTISLPQDISDYYVVKKLHDDKILVANMTKEVDKLTLNIWDLTKDDGEEHHKTICLPMSFPTLSRFNLFQKINGELLVMLMRKFLVMDLNRETNKELLATFNCQVSGIAYSQFFEDGRYLLRKTADGSLTRVKFPLLKDCALEEESIPRARRP